MQSVVNVCTLTQCNALYVSGYLLFSELTTSYYKAVVCSWLITLPQCYIRAVLWPEDVLLPNCGVV